MGFDKVSLRFSSCSLLVCFLVVVLFGPSEGTLSGQNEFVEGKLIPPVPQS